GGEITRVQYRERERAVALQKACPVITARSRSRYCIGGRNGMTLTQQEAQHIIRKLGESGIPPTRGLEAYTVGMDSILGTLESEYLKGYLRDGGSSFKLVVGEYGSGKSHFLYRLRDLAWESGYVVSRTELSPKE